MTNPVGHSDSTPHRLPSGEYFGEEIYRHEMDGLILVDSSYRPHTRIPPHIHESAFFYLVLEGTVDEQCGSARRQANQGCLVYHPSGETHSNHWLDSGGRCFHLEIANRWFARMRCQAERFDGLELRPGGPASWLAHRIHAESRSRDSASAIAIEGLTLALLAELMRGVSHSGATEQSPPRWLSAVRDLLESELDAALSLHDVADRIGVHPAHLARTFRMHFGESMGSYVRRRRIEAACTALSTTNESVAAIASAAGFYDQSHFCRTFLRQVGTTPKAYRQLTRPRN